MLNSCFGGCLPSSPCGILKIDKPSFGSVTMQNCFASLASCAINFVSHDFRSRGFSFGSSCVMPHIATIVLLKPNATTYGLPYNSLLAIYANRQYIFCKVALRLATFHLYLARKFLKILG
jgi:hypothetical protein